MDAIFEAATDPDHKVSRSLKLVMDRILPVAAFEKDIVKDAGRSAIQINITGVGSTTITEDSQQGEEIDGEAVDVTGQS